MQQDLVIQRPDAPQQLFLLFHGVGALPVHMSPLGKVLAEQFPQAAVICIASPDVSDFGQGFQWFSVQGVTEENRRARVQAAMPAFVATVRQWQQATGLEIEATALVGFSQGAIMALESTVLEPSILAGRIVSFAGRFAQLPETANPHCTLHLFHGKTDAVIPYQHTVSAAERVIALGGDLTADVLPGVGHEINADLARLLIERLRGHLPKRRWDEALRASSELN